MGFFQSHEATRWIEPPSLAPHISHSNLNGLAEDIKQFLAECVEDAGQMDNADWLEVARVLAAMEAACESLQTGAPALLEALKFEVASAAVARSGCIRSTSGVTPDLTLPLNLL
jgi:hypothetical protein